MYKTFVVLAYLRHVDKPVEIGYASSYDEAYAMVREWAGRPERVKDVSYFRVEGRYYV